MLLCDLFSFIWVDFYCSLYIFLSVDLWIVSEICRRPRPLSFSQFQMCQINSQSSRAYRRSHYCGCRNVPSVPISALLIYINVKYYSSVWHLFFCLPLMVLADPEENCIAQRLLFYSSEDSGVSSYVSFDYQICVRFFGGIVVWRFRNRYKWDWCLHFLNLQSCAYNVNSL